jgi:L-fuculose-phosphate aldolase
MCGNEKELRQTIVEIGRLVYEKGWVASNDGNISARLDQSRILATPTGVSKGRMSTEDLIICDMSGNKLEGTKDRTSEILMHTTIYEVRPDVQAVVHAHPPVATGFAVAGRPLNLALLPEVIIGLGSIPLAEYALPGTAALSDSLRPLIVSHDAVLMANHGVVSFGEDLFKAFYKLDTVEHSARIALVAELLGGPKVLPQKEVDKLLDARPRYGVSLRTGVDPQRPVTAEELDRSRRCSVSGD